MVKFLAYRKVINIMKKANKKSEIGWFWIVFILAFILSIIFSVISSVAITKLPLIPAMIIAIMYMYYNYIRFGNIFEFGHNYLPEFLEAEYKEFDDVLADIVAQSKVALNESSVLDFLQENKFIIRRSKKFLKDNGLLEKAKNIRMKK